MRAGGAMLGNLMLFVCLMLPGFLLGKTGKLGRGAITGITEILMYVAMPALVFSKLIEADVRAVPVAGWVGCFVASIPAVLLFLPLTRSMFGGEHERECRFCALFSNCGFLGLPLAALLFPEEPLVAVYVSLFNLFTNFLIWTLGVRLLAGRAETCRPWQWLLSPIFIAFVAGVVCSLCGVERYFPALSRYAALLAALATPLSMLALGAEFSQLRGLGFLRDKNIYLSASVKLILLPAAVGGSALLFSRYCGTGQPFAVGVFLAAAMPTAASAPAMSEKYGADGQYAAGLTFGGTLFSALTLPVLDWLFTLAMTYAGG